MLTDLSFPVTAKKIGPSSTVLGRPKVYYLNSSDLISMTPDTVRNATTLKVKNPKQKVEIYESPDEFLGLQALSQGATASQVFTKIYAALAPTSSATQADGTVPTKFYNEISTTGTVNTVLLPDPFIKRNFIIQNLTGTAVNVYARGATSPINGSTAAYSLGAYKRRHFLAPTAATAGTTAGWQTAIDA